MVMDINPGQAGSSPHNLKVVDGVLYFAADDGTHGTELWALEVSTSPRIYLPLVVKNG
jgi:hypothetical protein